MKLNELIAVLSEEDRAHVEARAKQLIGWQPIETAPKDGTPILIFEPTAGWCGDPRSSHMPTGALRDDEWTYRRDDPRLCWYDDHRFAIGYWRPWGGWGNRNSATVKPTHWMPLPAPPGSET